MACVESTVVSVPTAPCCNAKVTGLFAVNVTVPVMVALVADGVTTNPPLTAWPVPLRATVVADEFALLAIDSDALSALIAEGVNTTEIVQVDPAETDEQLLLWL